jgi:rRNA maturation endonuclease Nob1
MDLDRLSPSELNEYNKYRKKLHLYICAQCAHSFDREQPTANCIFCGSPVKEMERDDLPAAIKLYRYMCTSCSKSFVAEHADKCKYCGSKFLHFYEASKLSSREILSMRKRQIKNSLRKAVKRGKKK